MRTQAKSPSNIALVKYWGKHGLQLPLNPSVSFTLSHSTSQTRIYWREASDFGYSFRFHGKEQKTFTPKLDTFFQRIIDNAPELREHHLAIESENSFPHSSGIASSAAAFSALALAIEEGIRQLRNEPHVDLNRASEWSRLGSGSACRSLFPKAAVWGAHPKIEGSSDIRGLDVSQRLHPVFEDFHDVILLIDEGVKPVSSTAGHALMDGHVFGKARIRQAFDHVEEMMEILHAGNIDRFNELVELEALTLHALMMSAADPYLLMRPGTLEAIESVRRFRKETKTQVCFTLDAGANLHLLFPAASEQKVMPWVENALSKVSGGRYICDCVGSGPKWSSAI